MTGLKSPLFSIHIFPHQNFRHLFLPIIILKAPLSALAATCDALSITSLVAQKLLGASFSLARKCAGKPLLHGYQSGVPRKANIKTTFN